VVLFSLFEEQIRQETAHFDYLMDLGTESFAEALNYFPSLDEYHIGTEKYLGLIREAKESVDMPIIASLNGVSKEGWIEYAKQLEKAGADALELNIFFIPTNPKEDGRSVEMRYLDILKNVKKTISIPIALKLNPYFSAMAHMAKELDLAGADALVMFNRFFEPDINIETLEIQHSLSLSSVNEIRLPLLWIGVLYSRISASLAATTGVQGSEEIIKYLLAGADVVMTTSALLKNGIDYLQVMIEELDRWMEVRDLMTLKDMRGIMSQHHIKNPEAYERANYIKILEAYKS
jgi:dihydroorotate dehydrogenase (fumarate)